MQLLIEPDKGQRQRPFVKPAEWINGFYPKLSSDSGFCRSEKAVLAQVLEIREGGYIVRPWLKPIHSFGKAFFMPLCCVSSRGPVNFTVSLALAQ